MFAAPTEKELNLGYYVIIKSELPDEKVMYILYAHLKESSSVKGTVEAGSVIGISGVTGNAKSLKNKKDRQHVHIITKIGDKDGSYKTAVLVNPENYLTTKFNEDGTPKKTK